MRCELSQVIPVTVQGEGPYTGLKISLLRFSGCNLNCVWCDTAQLNNEKDEYTLSVNENVPMKNVLVTGGEPLINAQFEELLDWLGKKGKRVHIETNGLTFNNGHLRKYSEYVWVISPKLQEYEEGQYGRLILELNTIDKMFLRNVYLKFVICMSDQLALVDRFASQINKRVPIFCQPVNNDTYLYEQMITYGSEEYLYDVQVHKLMDLA